MRTARATTRKELLEEFEFPLEAEEEFKRDGEPARYATGHPKEWGTEQEIIDFAAVIKGDSERTRSTYHSALSADGKLLAISSNHESIVIYDIASKELRQVLEGTGRIAFRPFSSKNQEAGSAAGEEVDSTRVPAYTLISSISDEGFRGKDRNRLILWDLDQSGRSFDEEEPIDPSAFATKAIDAILPELAAAHEWSKDFVNTSTLHASFTHALGKVASDHRRRGNTVFEDASTGGFGSEPFSHDGTMLLYRSQNGSTQHGMREPEKLPQVVVYDLDAGREVHRLSGHADAIMWEAFSSNNQYIASVSWDGTMRMYSASIGDLLWTTPNSGGQCWSAAFSPDSKHIVWSCANGREIHVHAVADGKLVSKFTGVFQDWCRCLAWNPDGEQIALCAGAYAYVWRPFNGPTGSIVQHFQLANRRGLLRSIAGLGSVSWMDGGRLLGVQSSEGTKMVYDLHTNAKEMFKRPPGVDVGWLDFGLYELPRPEEDGEDGYLCVDEDGKVRFWPRIIAQSLPPIQAQSEGTSAQNVLDDGDEWVERGAAIWTAE
jgi:WD40 repeat protein